MSNLQETWKDIPGYEGHYQASSHGRIRSLDKEVPCRTGTRVRKGRVLKPSLHHTGYTIYSVGTKQKSVYGHKLVALAFLGEPKNGQVVCHFDGDKQNNNICNLRYDSCSGNEQDKRRHGTYQEGEGNPRASLSEEDVVTIRERRAKGEYCYIIGRDYGMQAGHISKICSGQLWKKSGGQLTRSFEKNA